MILAHEPSSMAGPVSPKTLGQSPALAGASAAFRFGVRQLVRNWRFGDLTFVTPAGRELRIAGSEPGFDARIIVRDYRFMRRVLASGDIGFADGYMAGEWETPDLTAVLSAMALNFDQLARMFAGGPVLRAVNAIGHRIHANSRRGARKNIHAHYDLGNAFYALWLDRSMTYSSARFVTPQDDLEAAQRAKYLSLAKRMDLRSGQTVLEIGCGWGGFAEFAAKEFGARVTGLTISKEQFDYARRRLFGQGLADRTDIRLADYRDLTGQFDRVASIEMFEAVGERYWPAYFGKIRDVLTADGLAGLQIITIRDDTFEAYRRRADFIQKYVFPGGMLPSEARLADETARAGLSWAGVARFGQDYAATLAEWGRRFDLAWGKIAKLGFDERFHRLWRFYLSYCEAGFRTERTNVIQLTLARG